jgi:His-Xaa-Ser system protein HxsD
LKQSLVLEFDAVAYPLSTVQKACYRFTNIASFEIQQRKRDDQDIVLVTARPLAAKSEDGLEHLGQLVRNEALDQSLREQIREQTEGVRNLVLAHAFSKIGLIAPDGAAPAA